MSILLITLFAITALLGGYLLSYVLFDKNTPKGVAIMHGVMGVASIVSLLIASFYYNVLFYSLVIFALAAVGGAVLISLDLLGKKIPKLLAVGHGLIAIVGFVVLCSALIYYL